MKDKAYILSIDQGRVCAGTIDSWIMWNLTGGARHVTDVSNASRTLLLNVHSCSWDDDILWQSREELDRLWKLEKTFEPRMSAGKREELYSK